MGDRVVPAAEATHGHDEAQNPDEVWIGVTDASLRRRLQNRLNQRESRRRRAERAAATGTSKALDQSAHRKLRPVAPNPIVSKPRDDSAPSLAVYSSGRLASGPLIAGELGEDGHPMLADGMLGLEVADGALTIVLPTLGVKTQEGEPLHVALFRSAALEQAVFYAMLVGGSTQRLTQTQSREDARVLMIAQNKTAEAVREALTRGTVTEGTLFAIMTLALKRNDASMSVSVAQRYPGAFSSSVRNVGGLDWMGQLQFASAHISMGIQLVRDGRTCEGSLPGLRDYLQLSELYRASLNLTRPGVELRPHTNTPLDDDTMAQFGVSEPDQFDVHDALKQVVADMRVCCQLIEQMPNMKADVNYFIHLRNETQYRLLCIPPDQDKAELLAIMIFSYGVIFPISDPWPLGQLTKKLYFEILAETAFDEARTQLLLWASLIGGIASWGGEFQGGYTLLVAKHAKTLAVRGWDEAVQILDKFLWLDTACSAGGQLVWGNALVYMS